MTSGRYRELDEAPDESKRDVRDLSPATINRKRVSSVGYLDDLGHTTVDPLALEGRICDRPWGRVVFLA